MVVKTKGLYHGMLLYKIKIKMSVIIEVKEGVKDMSLVVRYKGYYEPIEVHDLTFDRWKRNLKEEMEYIYSALTTRIPDESAFKKFIAETSQKMWEKFINPEWIDADLILLKRYAKIIDAYPSWSDGITKAFKDPGYFVNRVDGKADKFKRVRVTLGNVGTRFVYGRGIAVKAIGVISGWEPVLNDLKPTDEFEGTVVDVFLSGATKFVRPQAVAITTQGLVLAQYTLTAIGPGPKLDEVIGKVNTRLSNTVLKQVDTTKYSVDFHIGYDINKGKLFVESIATTV